MRSGKELLAASKAYASEYKLRSWVEVLLTIALSGLAMLFTLFAPISIWYKIPVSIINGLLYVRLFVIYHDYQHRAILQNSTLAIWLMRAVGVYVLAPEMVWKRTHEYHHNNNSKLSISGIGSYPTVSTQRYLTLTKKQKFIYLINRHPATILLGYITLFIYWLNLKSFVQSPGKHIDSLLALVTHFAIGFAIWYYLGTALLFLGWIIPFSITFGMGAYLFYCQHNFPGATFRENQDWTYDNAALSSTSYMVMNPVMHWFTGNIGYHHVHHLNSRIPFYRLYEVMQDMPELQNVGKTSWKLHDMIECFKLKLWDAEKGKMIPLRELNKN
ncbi:MAG: fatty acid desaturase [Cyclobacteriaceae bacterium]|nr:fatty acid desaturase [Cyclobacteriaceae bacterium]